MTTGLRVFVVSSIFSYRALFQWLNPGAYVFTKTLFPLMQMTFFTVIGAVGGARPLDFYVVGNALLVACRPMFTIANAVADERYSGTLPYMVASPANRVALFFGRSTFHVIDGVLDVLIAFAYAVLFFHLDLGHANVLGLMIAIWAAIVGASAIGLVAGAAAYVVLDATFLANTAMFTLLLLAGANVPLSDLPPWLLPLSYALPLTGSIEAARLYVAGAGLNAGLGLVLNDLILAIAWSTVGMLLFRVIEERARRDGTLEGT